MLAFMAAPSALEVVVHDSIWVTERPVWYAGVRQRARTTVVRLPGDVLWVHSPTAPTDEICSALDKLGEVRWIVVPNKFHHLQAPATAARYPKALVVGPPSAEARNPQLSVSMDLSHSEYVGATPELVPLHLGGVPFLDETVFFHSATGTLIAADLLACASARDHWTWRFAARIWGRYEKVRTPPDVRWSTRPSTAAAESIAQLSALPVQRILIAHGDPIVDRPVEQLIEAWNFAVPAARRVTPSPSEPT